ncbi:MAG: tig [Acidimicrobiia bacterium]|nr:tig [Acidimicrobiia bacterium]
MKSTVEPLEGNKVKVSVEVDETEFDKAVDDAFRKIAREVNIPGFRPGKAPRRILEARIGPDYARQQALNDSIPSFLARAVAENEVDIIAPPKIDITSGAEEGPVAFDAEIEIRPQITVAGYGGLRIELPSPIPSDEEVDAQVERLRLPFAEMNDVERPIADGDFVLIDLNGSSEGQTLVGLDVTDYLYTVGSGQIVAELDEQLIGASAGDTIEFSAPHPVESRPDIDFAIVIKGVKERVLPEVNDEWAKQASEFDTADELRADLVKRMTAVRAMQGQMALRDRTVDALVQLVDEEPPDAMVNDELRSRVEDFIMRLQAQGMSVEQYLSISGGSAETITEELRTVAIQGVKADLALRAVAEAESLQASDEDLEEEFIRLAQGSKQKPAQIRKAYERSEAVPSLRAELRKRKALEWLVERVEIVDPEGKPIDRALLNPTSDSDDSTDDNDLDSDSESGAEATVKDQPE